VEPVLNPGHSDHTAELLGFGAAVVLIVLARALLPAEEKRRARQPIFFLGLSVVFGFVAAWVDDKPGLDPLFTFLYALFLFASLGRSVVLLGVDVVYLRRAHRAPPRIFRDFSQAVAYIVVVLLTLRAIGVEPGSLLTTSALLTAVIGLALQDTLGNMVSGLALQMQRPFEVGDWIQFASDARDVGRVTEVNWRATTVVTGDKVEVTIPNAHLAKASIRNYSRPTTASRRSVVVEGPYGVPPTRVARVIRAALADAPGVLAAPEPWVDTNAFNGSGIEYAVNFFTDDFAHYGRIEGLVRDRIWFALKRAAIEVPFPHRVIQTQEPAREVDARTHQRELERREQVLRGVDFLDVLPPAAQRALAASVAARPYAPGEAIVTQGSVASELYMIDAGTVAVELPRPGAPPLVVAQLGPGKFFGEMGLMTGETRNATVRAVSECHVLVLSREAFQAVLAAQPELVDRMGELLAHRQAQLEAAASTNKNVTVPMQERSRRLVSQIKIFFKL
jgi:small-conductance mechanosensitive channel/CRP-like cAMP-binding protein